MHVDAERRPVVVVMSLEILDHPGKQIINIVLWPTSVKISHCEIETVECARHIHRHTHTNVAVGCESKTYG